MRTFTPFAAVAACRVLIGRNAQIARFAKFGVTDCVGGVTGPEPTLVLVLYAAVQLPQSGRRAGVRGLFIAYGTGE